MSDEKTSTSGDGQDAGGSLSSDSKSVESTGYSETFVKKLKTEKDNWSQKAKALEEKLREFEEKEKQAQEQQLKEQNKWQEYAKIKESERDEAFKKLQTMSERIENAQKFNAVIEAIPGQVKRQYWGLIDSHLSEIVMNPETGEPDPVSVKNTADKIRETYPEVILFNDKRQLPQDAAKSGGSFTLDQWESMDAKQKKENLHRYVELKQRG